MSESNPIQAAAESSSDTPEAVDSDGIIPSLSTRQTALIVGTVVVGVAVLLWLRRNGTESGSQTGGEIPSQISEDAESASESGATDEEAITGQIEVPPNPSDPMAADEAVMDALRARGRITTMTEEG